LFHGDSLPAIDLIFHKINTGFAET